MKRSHIIISTLSILFLSALLTVLSTAPRAFADSGDSQGASTTFADTGKPGVGLTWAPLNMVQGGSNVFTNTGFVDARYWFNDKFGIDGGIGLGLPQISPESSILLTMNLEPMLTLVTRKHSIIYANIDILPALNTGAGLPSELTVSAGIGIESQITDIPQLAWFAQWNPVSLNWNFPSGGPNATSFIFMGALMNVMLGFHYYL